MLLNHLWAWWMTMATISIMRPPLMNCSYLGRPRLNFAGQFRADSDVQNNKRCNYRLDHPSPQTESYLSGTNEFQFLDSKVASVVYENGQTSLTDPIVGSSIVGNLNQPFAKLVDLDVDVQDKATIYGMKFGVSWKDGVQQNRQDVAFYGKWTPSIISQDIWQRIVCYPQSRFMDELYPDSYPFSSQGTTFIIDIKWGRVDDSPAMMQFKNAVGFDGQLSVRITIFYYTRNSPHVSFNATVGHVIGTIGVANSKDTLNFGGQRLLVPTKNVRLYLEDGDLNNECNCINPQPWVYKAPFEVDMQHKLVSVDLSNSLPFSLNNSLCDINTLWVGILVRNASSDECVHIIGSEGIPYMVDEWMKNSGGIYSNSLDDVRLALLSHAQLVIAQIVTTADQGGTVVCGESGIHSTHILLQESPYFVRPKGYFVDRLEYKDTSTQTLYVTHFGEPAENIPIKLLQNGKVIPSDGVVPDKWVKVTNSSGLVSFQFTVPNRIPYPRQYANEQCNPPTKFLPIDGQVYLFRYCIDDEECIDYEKLYSVSSISFLAFSTIDYAHPPYWVDGVQPIFTQYAQLSPIMMTILNLSSYTDITQERNRFLLNLSLNLPFEDPGYMPTTRDLSPTKRKMIIEWFQNPLYSPSSPKFMQYASKPSNSSRWDENLKPARCLEKKLSLAEGLREDLYFESPFSPNESVRARPLFDLLSKSRVNVTSSVPLCSKEALKEQLQTAIALEFATVPLYLTALYSIVDGYNQYTYRLLHSLVMQNMLHMNQLANILIALGGVPIIDNSDTVPSYPMTGLPGGVLPQLHIPLKKFSLSHVFEVLMGIHAHQPGPYTFDRFYSEILECIKFLGDNSFDSTTAAKQVKWPLNATESMETVIVVTDADSALYAITKIMSIHSFNSTVLVSNNLKSYYRLEEIVCERQLELIDKHYYAYSGAAIPFDALGVWPMREEPNLNDIEPHSNCYIESKAFHIAYRALLRKLKEVFNGHPEGMTHALQLMETLQVHGKKLMWIHFHPNDSFDNRTCGPVWEYE